MFSIHKEDFCFRGGDVEILVKGNGDEEISGLVYSQIMCLSSEIWEKFIYPPFPRINLSTEEEEASPEVSTILSDEHGIEYSARKSTGIKRGIIAIVDFTEDDPEALLILLNIAHHNITTLPKELNLDLAYKVAGLVEQYQLLRLVKPYQTNWFAEIWESIPVSSIEKTLFLAYVFGHETEFINLCSRIVKHVTVEEDGKLYYSEARASRVLEHTMFPPGVEENIKTSLDAAKLAISTFIDVTVTFLRINCMAINEDTDNDPNSLNRDIRKGMRAWQAAMTNATMKLTISQTSDFLENMFFSAYKHQSEKSYLDACVFQRELWGQVEYLIVKAVGTMDLRTHMRRAKEQLAWT